MSGTERVMSAVPEEGGNARKQLHLFFFFYVRCGRKVVTGPTHIHIPRDDRHQRARAIMVLMMMVNDVIGRRSSIRAGELPFAAARAAARILAN